MMNHTSFHGGVFMFTKYITTFANENFEEIKSVHLPQLEAILRWFIQMKIKPFKAEEETK